MRALRLLLRPLFLAITASAQIPIALAKEVLGPTYPIAEEDVVTWLERRAAAFEASPKGKRLAENARQAQEAAVKRPPRVTQVSTAQHKATRWFDPSLTVPYDLKDADGRVIAATGTTVNPFDYVALSKALLFFDGDDARQVVWAERESGRLDGRVKPILIGGSPVELSGRFGRAVYFDLGGKLVEKLGIQTVPARVSQDGKRLRIEEMPP